MTHSTNISQVVEEMFQLIDSCLAQLKDFVLSKMDKGMHTEMNLTLQKAFNTLNHKILLENATYPAFRTPIIDWFEFHLSTRKFLITVDDQKQPPNVFYKVNFAKFLRTFFLWNTSWRLLLYDIFSAARTSNCAIPQRCILGVTPVFNIY